MSKAQNNCMHWEKLLSAKRFGMEEYPRERQHTRTEFQRDYDRLIFSSPFRRLQNKTQVFPLPGSIFVHNRLTHSLEVACVGRSLGTNVALLLTERYQSQPWQSSLFDIGAVVAAACLAHDMGNPPFGHSGEQAISTYFSEGNGRVIEALLKPAEWQDLTHFEGNANAFRLLTHQFNGRRKGGFVMTYTTLASIVKYPYSSSLSSKKGKAGFFESEKADFCLIADELGLINQSVPEGVRYVRHPLVLLVEAADDICYQVMDIEDAHKLKILSTEEVKGLFLGFFDEKRRASIERTLQIVTDTNEQIAYIRSSVVGILVEECSRLFVEREAEILRGEFSGSLINALPLQQQEAYQACSKAAWKHIYKSSDVLDIELAGNRIISVLLDKLTHAVQHPNEAYSQLILNKVPSQYEMSAPSLYARIQAVIDYISGMTDVYALDLYRKINGMSLPAL